MELIEESVKLYKEYSSLFIGKSNGGIIFDINDDYNMAMKFDKEYIVVDIAKGYTVDRAKDYFASEMNYGKQIRTMATLQDALQSMHSIAYEEHYNYKTYKKGDNSYTCKIGTYLLRITI